MKKISVIVPVYKVEAYLDRCVQSIVDQSYRNLEIILVDDGSPDRCPELCDAWARKDARIRVIHQNNAGAGAARNAGIAVAAGDFFAFVDSDDCLSPHMYEHLLNLMDTDTDIVECDFFATEALSPAFPPIEDTCEVSSHTPQQAMEAHIADHIFRQTIWNKLYRRHTIQGVLFPVGKLIDDEFWTYRVLGNAKKLKHSTAKLYAYMQQPDSVMHISYSLRRLQAVEAKEKRLAYVKDFFPSLVPQAAANLWGTCLYQGQMSLKHLCKEEQSKAFLFLKEATRFISFKIIRYSDLSLLYRIWFTLSKLSFRITCKLRNLLNIGL